VAERWGRRFYARLTVLSSLSLSLSFPRLHLDPGEGLSDVYSHPAATAPAAASAQSGGTAGAATTASSMSQQQSPSGETGMGDGASNIFIRSEPTSVTMDADATAWQEDAEDSIFAPTK